jgi:transposase
MAEIGAKHGVYLTLAASWKPAAIDGMGTTIATKSAAPATGASTAKVSKLHANIGELIIERDF